MSNNILGNNYMQYTIDKCCIELWFASYMQERQTNSSPEEAIIIADLVENKVRSKFTLADNGARQ